VLDKRGAGAYLERWKGIPPLHERGGKSMKQPMLMLVAEITLALIPMGCGSQEKGQVVDHSLQGRMRHWLTHPVLNDARLNTDEEFEPLSSFEEYIGKIRAMKDAEKLLQEILANDPCELIRSRSAMVLGCVGTRNSVAVLLQSLKSDEPRVQANAAGALGQLRAVEAIDALCSASKSKDVNVRANACIALGRVGGGKAVQSLRVVIKDEKDQFVKNCAVTALGMADAGVQK
jgi:hypothetical protein